MRLLDLMDPAIVVDVRVEPVRPSCRETAHQWEPTVTVWPGENFERFTKTCTKCGEVRGRA